MRDVRSSSQSSSWMLGALAGTCFGLIAGYIIATQQHIQQQQLAVVATAAPATAPATPATAGSAPALINEAELKTYRDLLTRDPKNVEAAIRLGNMLYDAQRYSEAIPYYQQALTIQPQNVNVSTDLGTALWYSGHADRALAQYDKSLAIDADHSQTLFNVGIVRLDGKQDPRGAIEVWEKLLSVEPGYANAAKVRELISTARTKSFDASF